MVKPLKVSNFDIFVIFSPCVFHRKWVKLIPYVTSLTENVDFYYYVIHQVGFLRLFNFLLFKICFHRLAYFYCFVLMTKYKRFCPIYRILNYYMINHFKMFSLSNFLRNLVCYFTLLLSHRYHVNISSILSCTFKNLFLVMQQQISIYLLIVIVYFRGFWMKTQQKGFYAPKSFHKKTQVIMIRNGV